MISKKKEGGFYASKVRQFLNEYDGIPLEEFCKAEKVSYSKMLNCLGRSSKSYRPVRKTRSDVSSSAAPRSEFQLPVMELKELVVDLSDNHSTENCKSSGNLPRRNPEAAGASRLIEDITIYINGRFNIGIGKCDIATLSALIKEMEVSL